MNIQVGKTLAALLNYIDKLSPTYTGVTLQ